MKTVKIWTEIEVDTDNEDEALSKGKERLEELSKEKSFWELFRIKLQE